MKLEDRLFFLQENENDGRGISCIRSVIGCLRSGDKASALAVVNNEWDKISSYPRIANCLKESGLASSDSYVPDVADDKLEVPLGFYVDESSGRVYSTATPREGCHLELRDAKTYRSLWIVASDGEVLQENVFWDSLEDLSAAGVDTSEIEGRLKNLGIPKVKGVRLG